MLILEPKEFFPITYQIDDPLNTDTLYVQAVIRNSVKDTIIDTVNLTDLGDQRFRNTWNVIEDPSGAGLYITITIKVYTDSGYTTQSDVFAIEQTQYIIQPRYNRILGGGGPGGSTINYKKLGKIVSSTVEKEIKRLPKAEKQIKTNLKPINKTLQKLNNELNDTKNKSDFNNREAIKLLSNEIATNRSMIIKAIDDKHIPEPEKVDLQPLQTGIESLVKNITIEILTKISNLPEPEKFDYEKILEEVRNGNIDSSKLINDLHKSTSQAMLDAIDADRDITFAMPFHRSDKKKQAKEAEQQENDEKETEKQKIRDRRISGLAGV